LKTLEKKGYKHIRHISTGGQGQVHLVKRKDKLFIAKTFDKLDDDSLDLLKHIKQLGAPNVPIIYEIFNTDTQTTIIRDYIEGRTLYEEIKAKGALPLARALFITCKICETLHVFHSLTPNPIIYRDLKPENIMIAKDNSVFLIDFGIARYYKDEVTRDTVLAGTKGYTAPEVMAGLQSDNRSDIYSVGLILYEMLTGQNLLMPPYQIRPINETKEDLPQALDKIIAKATDINMVMRYEYITQFCDALSKVKHPAKKRLRWLGIVAAVLLFGIAVLTGVQYATGNSWFGLNSNTPYSTLVDLAFDEASDAEWLQLAGPQVDTGKYRAQDAAMFFEDGNYLIDNPTLLTQNLSPDTFVHARIKIDNADDAQLTLAMYPTLNADGGVYMIIVPGEGLGLELITDFGYIWDIARGSSIIGQSEWLDIIIHLSKDGEALRYVLSYTDNASDLSYGGIRVMDEWVGGAYRVELSRYLNWRTQAQIDSAPSGKMAFVRLVDGSLAGYLDEHIAAPDYKMAQLKEFFMQDIASVPITPH